MTHLTHTFLDVARAVVRRFADAMANHDHQFDGYDMVTFSSKANYIGRVNHRNMEDMWHRVRFGGGTRVMTGWQKVKELHFEKHAESAIHHPVFGWQAGPETPMLRLLLLLPLPASHAHQHFSLGDKDIGQGDALVGEGQLSNLV